MDHSEWFQASLDIKASLTHSFNPETKPTALGRDYFYNTSVSALAPSSRRAKPRFYLEQQPGYSHTTSSHRLSCQQPLGDNPWLLPWPQTSQVSPLTLPTLLLTAQPWAEARPGWWSQRRGLPLVNLPLASFISLQESQGVGKGVPRGRGGTGHPHCFVPGCCATGATWCSSLHLLGVLASHSFLNT